MVAERPTYFVTPIVSGAVANGGDVALGAEGPSAQWLLAEGTTRAGFREFLTIQNPASQSSSITVAYLFGPGQGAPLVLPYTVAAASRMTIDVNAVAGTGKDVSVSVKSPSTAPVVVERPLYFVTGLAGGASGGTVVRARAV